MPNLKNKHELNGILKFTIYNIHHSVANAIRRTVLSDIPCVVIKTFPDSENQCNIIKNTSRFHNEIIKQRLSCIPIHLKPDDKMDITMLEVYVHKKNTSKIVEFVTTEDFEVMNGGNPVDKKTVNKIFKPFVYKGDKYYIDLVKLRPSLSDNIQGEELEFKAKLSISTAKSSGMYNVVSKCSYVNTQDIKAGEAAWTAKKATLKETDEELKILEQNWGLLDAKRYVIPESFDFTIESIGIYENEELVQLACDIIQNQLNEYIQGNKYIIRSNDTTMKNSMDIVFEQGDYTIGKLLEYQFYKQMFPKVLGFVSFFKVHPHHPDGIIRLAFENEVNEHEIQNYLTGICKLLIDEFNEIKKLFKS